MTARLRQGVADLHPAYAALVMATGIVSTGLASFDWQVLSDILLAVAALAFVLLMAAYVWRAVAFPGRVRADSRDPGRAFGYFSLVAAPNVLASRLALDGHLPATAALAAASIPVWLVLTYAIPGAMVVGRRRGPVLPRTNGSWFMWVVGTQSLAGVTAAIAAAEPDLTAAFAPLAVAFWGIGVVLYLMLVGLVTVRLLDDQVTPHALSPTYWVYMGATAISVLAAAGLLALPASLPVMAQTRQVISGLAFLLRAFGTWWIPFLLSFGVRRHLVERERVGYEPTLWSMVFPLGMYGAASASYGRVTGMDFMVDIARVEVWIGFAAWAAVAIAMGRALLFPGEGGAAPAQHEAHEVR
ncbi:tellurite resistance protein permease [Streptomyces diacarni]|uniref:Tellurite resistance protein permease n=1 Tax=Streptomyces diacarni TaxID=2800381 RepID=A0A367EFI1_9ACTN|nr:tellurite resistance/C4-dicarboxylate transporter family protein [Streptomyces diacarni]RCG16846.1 tellurite resistance protein permease [Streptomyces diacarni]